MFNEGYAADFKDDFTETNHEKLKYNTTFHERQRERNNEKR
jgi:hypothetical protein